MKIVSTNTTSFWKGEAGIKGLVEDQARTFEVQLYLKGNQVRDYSCTCPEGNSYKGMCAHEEALFAYYKECQALASKPPVHTSAGAHTMIREYTNREVAGILAESEAGTVRLVPSLLLDGREARLEFKLGAGRLYALRDLSAFCEAVENGACVEYGRELSFHHQKSAFVPESRGLLSMVLGLTEGQKAGRELLLSRMNRDRFFEVLCEEELETALPGALRLRLKVCRRDPVAVIRVEKYGRDGIRAVLEGVKGETEEPESRVVGSFFGEKQFYILTGECLYVCSEACSAALGPFIEQITRDREHGVLIGQKDIPLFYERVVKAVRPWSEITFLQVDLEAFRPEPLKAEFRFSLGASGELLMEPVLSYGDYSFHPVEDENLPRTICRDVPAEFRVSQVISRYFRFKDPEGHFLVIRGNDEEGLYRLLDQGVEEFKGLGQVYFSEEIRDWRVLPSAGARVEVRAGDHKGWLEITVDAGELGGQELSKILAAYTQKKKYYRLKNGQFLKLEEGGLLVVAGLAGELGVEKKELQSGRFLLPAYRALYLDQALKESQGVAFYRDQLFKAVVRGIKSVEDDDAPVPEGLADVLREYQKTGYRWLKTLDRYGFGGILADDMGLGKTLQVIALLRDAYEQGERQPSLIVCPASLVYNWEHEIQRFAPKLRVLPVVGKGEEREKLLAGLREDPSSYQAVITSYDLLKRDLPGYEELSFRFQLIDEAQYIKNASTQSSRAVKAVKAQTRFALTGTPVENRLGELWSIFDFLMPGFLFKSQYFKKEYETPITREGDQKALRRLRQLIGPFVLRRLKGDVLKELPEKLEQVVYSSFEEEQRRLYAANALVLKEKLESGSLGPGGRDQLQILSELMRLRQLCCDPRLCYGDYRGGSAKLETCMDLIRRGIAGEHRILLFSQFTSMLELIEERLKKEEIACLKLTGATSKEERIRLAESFKTQEAPVFLISLKAGGTGLNLTAADVVIHYDPWWNVAAQNQATDRAHRIGQEKQVTVYRLITRNTIEENILKLQESKRQLADQIVTEGTISLSSLTREDLLHMIESEE